MQQAVTQVASAETGQLKPFTPAPPQAAVGGGGGLQREVFGFALASSLSDPTFGYPSWNFSLLSTVAFFGLHVQGDGTFAADSGAGVWNSSQLTNLLTVAHAHGTKVVLTIILQDFAAGTPNMCAGLSKSAITIANTVAEVKAKGVDGVNVDYEGLNGSCGSTTDPSFARHAFTNFVTNLRSALGAAPYLSVDTYASSAADPGGFFDIAGLASSADSFFVMAYDLEYANYLRPPLSCSSFCLGPTAPLSGYYYNDSSTAAQYKAAVPASKVILGVPYYGRKACVAGSSPNQYPTGPVTADSYLDASTELSAPGPGFQPGSYVAHRDANDPAGQERWDTWFNTSFNCTRELYWDDAVSLGRKYDLVNAGGLRGVGLWNLNYGGGAPELWSVLSTKFTTAAPWTSLGGGLIQAPAASSWGASRKDVFIVGTDSGLYQRTWDGTSWGGWLPLGGRLTSRAAAVSWGPNRIDVFGRGTDGALYHRWWDTAGWHPWEGLGGRLLTGARVASWGNGRLDVFVVGTDSGLYHKWFDTAGWHDWEGLGGRITADPSAVASGPNRVDVFARGTDNAIYHRSFDTAGGWHGWEGLGGNLISGPAASSCASGHLDVFAVATDSALYRIGFNGGWGAWQRVGGDWTSDPSAVCPPATTTVHLFERGTDYALWQSSLSGS